jgi:hypothetical protein
MKTIIRTLFILLSFLSSFGQTENEAKYQFAQKVFNSDKYVKVNYDKFPEQIILTDSTSELFGDTILRSYTYRFKDKAIIVWNVSSDLRLMFENGVFNPNVIFGNETIKMSKTEIENLNQSEKIIFDHNRNDSLTINGLEELDKLNPNVKTKRFRFLVWKIGFANPTEYYIEFYNDKATKETEWYEFIEYSKMTFYYKGTILI